MNHNYIPIDRTELEGLHRQGLRTKELAAWFHCSDSTINDRLARWGLRPRQPAKGRRRVTADLGEIATRYRGGESVHKLSRAFGVSPTWVCHALARVGVTMRSPSEYRGELWRGRGER
jgi:transposase